MSNSAAAESVATKRTDWIVRPATLEDKQGCDALLNECYSKLLQPDYDSETLSSCLPLITHAQDKLLTCGTWYVVEHPESGRIVGCGGWTKEQPNVDRGDSFGDKQCLVPHLRHFASHPKFTRQGIARSLWNRTVADIASAFSAFPKLEVYSTRTALKFYESCGFQTVTEIDLPLPNDAIFPAVLMVREPK